MKLILGGRFSGSCLTALLLAAAAGPAAAQVTTTQSGGDTNTQTLNVTNATGATIEMQQVDGSENLIDLKIDQASVPVIAKFSQQGVTKGTIKANLTNLSFGGSYIADQTDGSDHFIEINVDKGANAATDITQSGKEQRAVFNFSNVSNIGAQSTQSGQANETNFTLTNADTIFADLQQDGEDNHYTATFTNVSNPGDVINKQTGGGRGNVVTINYSEN